MDLLAFVAVRGWLAGIGHSADGFAVFHISARPFAKIGHSANGFADFRHSASQFAGIGHSDGIPHALWPIPANPVALCSILANPSALWLISANPFVLCPFLANRLRTVADSSTGSHCSQFQ